MRAPTPASERSGSVSALKPILACAGVSDWARAAPELPINEESRNRLDKDIGVFSSRDQTHYVLIRGTPEFDSDHSVKADWCYFFTSGVTVRLRYSTGPWSPCR